MTGKRAAAPSPDVTKDFDLNKFITGVLEDAKSREKDRYAQIGNTQIDRTVKQLRAFFADEYAADDNGTSGNVATLPEREHEERAS